MGCWDPFPPAKKGNQRINLEGVAWNERFGTPLGLAGLQQVILGLDAFRLTNLLHEGSTLTSKCGMRPISPAKSIISSPCFLSAVCPNPRVFPARPDSAPRLAVLRTRQETRRQMERRLERLERRIEEAGAESIWSHGFGDQHWRDGPWVKSHGNITIFG